jgi:hypothetical protein
MQIMRILDLSSHTGTPAKKKGKKGKKRKENKKRINKLGGNKLPAAVRESL